MQYRKYIQNKQNGTRVQDRSGTSGKIEGLILEEICDNENTRQYNIEEVQNQYENLFRRYSSKDFKFSEYKRRHTQKSDTDSSSSEVGKGTSGKIEGLRELKSRDLTQRFVGKSPKGI